MMIDGTCGGSIVNFKAVYVFENDMLDIIFIVIVKLVENCLFILSPKEHDGR